MRGVLLDTHALYWLVAGSEILADEALIAIGESQAVDALFVSPVSAWELGVASLKSPGRRPDLGDLAPARWFREAIVAVGARVIPIRQRIAAEAASVPADTGHRDPGDCFLIATARARSLAIVTRDGVMLNLARERPDYLSVVAC